MMEATAGGVVIVAWSVAKPEAWNAIAKVRIKALRKMLLIPDELRMMMMDSVKDVKSMGKK